MATKIAKRRAVIVLGGGWAVAAVAWLLGCGELLVLDADPSLPDVDAGADSDAAPGETDAAADADDDSGRCRGAFDEPILLQYPSLPDAGDLFPRFRGIDEARLVFHSDRPNGGRSKLFTAAKTGLDAYGNVEELADAALFGASSAVEPFVEGDVVYFSLVGNAGAMLVRLDQQQSPPNPWALGITKAAYNRAPYLTETEMFFASYDSIEKSKIYRVARDGDGGFGSPEEVPLHDGVAVGTPVLSKNGKTLFYSYEFDLNAKVYSAKRQADGRFENREEAIARKGVLPSYITDDECRLFVTFFLDGKWRLGVANRQR